jgi:ATP-dependent DNA helicase RecG
MEDSKRVGIISVPQGIFKPYVVRHNSDETIFIRMGSRVQKAARELQARLFESGSLFHIDGTGVPGTELDSLDFSRLEYYLKDILNEEAIPEKENELIKLLIGKGLMCESAYGDAVCTITGIICFGLKPRRWIPQAGLRVMSFSGTEMVYQAQLDAILDVPLVGRWQKTGKNERNPG